MNQIPAPLRDVAPFALLVAVNLIPLAGVAWFGWQLGTIMVLYWVENGVIGLFNIPRIAMAAGPPTEPRIGPFGVRSAGPSLLGSSRAAMIVGFVTSYGLFWFVHGVFVFALFASPGAATPFGGEPSDGVDWSDVALGAIGLAAYHAVAFIYWDLYRREYLAMSPQAQVYAPYPRLIALHLTIILGAYLIIETGQPIAALALLVLIKTGFDLAGSVRAHVVRAGDEAGDPTAS